SASCELRWSRSELVATCCGEKFSSSSSVPPVELPQSPSPAALVIESKSDCSVPSDRSSGSSTVADVAADCANSGGGATCAPCWVFSSSGFSCSSRSTSAFSSSVDNWSSRIDCCSCGVSVRCWLSLSWSVGFIGIPRQGASIRLPAPLSRRSGGGRTTDVAERKRARCGRRRCGKAAWPAGTRACPGLSSSWLKAEMLSQIDLPDVFIINNLVRRSRGQHTAFVDDVGPVADAQGLAHVVIRDHHADFAFLQEADDLLY